MKKAWFFSALVLLSNVIGAQDYHISFAVSGNGDTLPDSVVVHYVKQDHEITLQGDDTLHLLASSSGMSNLETQNKVLQVYPNPCAGRAHIVFHTALEGEVELSLYDLAGRSVARHRQFQPAGKTMVEVIGLSAGAYVLWIDTETSSLSEVLLSKEPSAGMPELHVTGSGVDAEQAPHVQKSADRTGKMVNMTYHEGDTLTFTAYLGSRSSDLTLVPVGSSTLSFEFQTNQEAISASADIMIEGGTLQVTDEAGNRVKLSFPPGAVMDTVSATLTLLGSYKDLPFDERHLRTFEITPKDINLYEPVTITIEYNSPISDLNKTALYRLRSEDWLSPLSDHAYSDDDRSVTASTLILGEFAEGKMTLEKLNAQFDLLLSSKEISWKSSPKDARETTRPLCDTRIHKAIWDDWKDVLGSFISFFKQRYLLGYYNDLQEGQHTYEEEQELLCKNVASMGIESVLDQCIPDDLCDRDYSHTISSMVRDMELLGCEDSIVDLLGQRFDQMLLNCGSSLVISSVLDIESGGLQIYSSGTVPITTRLNSDKSASVLGTGTLSVTGSGSAGGPCSGTVSGETLVTVQGNRNAAYTYELQVFTAQDALLTTVCPDGTTVNTPLAGEDAILINLSMANDYTYSEDMPVDGGQFVIDISLNNPYISLPVEY